MSAPVVATGISVHPSTNAKHVIIRLHDDEGAVLALVLMDAQTAKVVQDRVATSRTQLSHVAAGTGAVN